MNAQDRFQRVEAIFRDALRLRPEQRSAFLDDECVDDDVRAEVVALLDEDALTRGAVDEPVMGKGLETVLAPESVRQMPERIGPYRLLSLLGEGGFGAVYLAEQRAPVQRRVAVKVLKPGMDTRQVIARFEAERQALAMMDHPSIARVFDAGATETGRPYFVMELVRGVPVTQYCDDRGLGTRERVELFLQICRAVQHAHQKGVIHRDLKPSNVLVIEQDGQAVPKVIDFGIAKATGARLTEKTLVTEFRQFIGTPEYMSPEQAGMGDLDIDTRSDIYALGVLLYELLTGTTPFDSTRLRSAAFGELQRIIREVDPQKPSTRLRELSRVDTAHGRVDGASRDAHVVADSTLSGGGAQPTSLQRIAKCRNTEPHALRRQLRGDLDWIVMRAMEKDRNRRYESASALADDLSRHLRYEPVEAGPPSMGYRASKFVRRHRMGVAAGAFASIAVLTGSGLAIGGMITASQQRDRALAEQQRATAINEFLIEDLLAEAAPENNPVGDSITVNELLDRAAAKIDDGRFDDQPHTRAGVLGAIADAYYALGDYDRSVEHWRRAAELAEQSSGPLTEPAAHAYGGLAQALQAQGSHDDSAAAFQRAIAANNAAFSSDDPQTLNLTNNYAELFVAMGRLDDARPLHEENLERSRKLLGSNDPGTLDSMNNLAAVYYLRGDYERAEQLFRETWTRRQEVLGENHPLTLVSMSNLGVTLKAQDKLEETEAIYRAVLEADLRVQGPEHPDTLTDMHNLASLLAAQEKFDEAAALHAETIALRRKVLGEDHPVIAHSLIGLGDTLRQMNRPVEAEPHLREALEIRTAKLSPDHHLTISAVDAVAGCLMDQEKADEAERVLLGAWDDVEPIAGAEEARRSIAGWLVAFYEQSGRSDDAARWRARREALTEDPP